MHLLSSLAQAAEDAADEVTAVFVRLRFDVDFDASRLADVAQRHRSVFEGLPGLRSKAFTKLHDAAEAVNVYLWRSEGEARSFFNPAFVDAIADAYGVRPQVNFARVLALVDNASGPDAPPEGRSGVAHVG